MVGKIINGELSVLVGWGGVGGAIIYEAVCVSVHWLPFSDDDDNGSHKKKQWEQIDRESQWERKEGK